MPGSGSEDALQRIFIPRHAIKSWRGMVGFARDGSLEQRFFSGYRGGCRWRAEGGRGRMGEYTGGTERPISLQNSVSQNAVSFFQN
jgi:hypothetical protein